MAAAAKYDWETIRAEYEAGANQSDLSGRHGVSRGAVRKHIAAEGWTRNSSGTVSRMAEDRAAGCDPAEGAEALNRAAQGVAVVMMRHKAEWERHQCLIDEAMETGDPDKAKFAKITAEALKIRQEGERRAWGIVESDVRPAAARKTEQDAIRQGIREAFLSVGMGDGSC